MSVTPVIKTAFHALDSQNRALVRCRSDTRPSDVQCRLIRISVHHNDKQGPWDFACSMLGFLTILIGATLIKPHRTPPQNGFTNAKPF